MTDVEVPDPLPFTAQLWDASGKLVGIVYARAAKSIRALLEEREDVEVALVDGPDLHTKVWRDAETRAWRWR